jgi:uncharacterized protein
MTAARRPTFAELVALLDLQPLPVEGGMFVQTWRSADADEIRGTATFAAFTDDPDSFSAMHRLPVDEIWHFYLGDPVDLLLLHVDGSFSTPRLGHDVLGGELLQLVVPAGTWMGGALAPGGQWALFGNTMAPGFRSEYYQGGDADILARRWPEVTGRIRHLTRPGDATHMPPGL